MEKVYFFLQKDISSVLSYTTRMRQATIGRLRAMIMEISLMRWISHGVGQRLQVAAEAEDVVSVLSVKNNVIMYIYGHLSWMPFLCHNL